MTRACLWAAVAASACLISPSMATAALVIVESHHAEFTGSTPWTEDFLIPQYNGVEPLAEIMVTTELVANGSVIFSATTNTTVNSVDVNRSLDLSGPNGFTDSIMGTDTLAPPQLVISAGGMETLNVDISETDMATLNGASDLAAHTGAGNVTYTMSAMAGLSNLDTIGGNVEISQMTNVTGRLWIDYKVDEPAIPEPMSAAIWTGMLGLGLATFRRRR